MSLVLASSDRHVPGLLIEAAAVFGDRIAWTDGERSRSFAELPRLASGSAEFLARRGIEPGDRVLVISENRLEILDLLLGCAWLGALLVPINPATPPSQRDYFLEYVEPKIVFFEGDAVPEEGDTARMWERLPDRAAGEPAADWIAPGSMSLPTDIRPDTPLTVLLTSGTTGVSKGVVCPHGQFIAWGESVASMLDLREGDIAYTCLPLFHTNALNALFQCLTSGATFHVGQRFSSSRFWQRNAEAGSTVSYLLGAMVSMLLNTPVTEFDRAHTITRILAPGTPTPALEAFEERFGVVLVEGHGMTETNAALGTPFGSRRLGYMGRVMDGYEATVVDDMDQPVDDGQPGELLLRSNIPFAFATGYWRLPEVTVASNRNQWFHTGDRVVRDDGWFRFLDRIKDVIRRRGENISAWEVERVLDEHPQVLRSAVIPVPSELGEDEVMAFVISADGDECDPEVLRQHCAEFLPAFAMPRFLEFITELPLTETGKVRKQVLRERGVGASTWDAHSELGSGR